jgi:membrane-bound lytic murein transglycosylase D
MRRSPWSPLPASLIPAVLALTVAGVARAEPPARAATRSHAPRPASSPRHAVAAGPTADDVALGAESPELRALHDAERELFPPAAPAVGTPWPSELPAPLSAPDDLPAVHASGLPPAPAPNPLPVADAGKSLAWLARLSMPDLPVRWDPRVVRYLEFFKDDPRGRATFAHFYKRSGRYGEMIRRTLARKSLPGDLLWVAMVESGFDPTIRSPAGASGMWQFMPDAGKSYGLAEDRWLDARLDPEQATSAAADFLGDLHRRFGSWELALGAYNMGYGGMASVVRRYNSNDFWTLSRAEGSMPWETTLYVPKILAIAVVARNLDAFWFAEVTLDPPVEADEVRVPPGTPLAVVAGAAGCTQHDLDTLNPELRASRTPPAGGDATSYAVKVPRGRGAQAEAALAHVPSTQPPLERYVVRFGETLEQVATAKRTTVARLVELNGIGSGEVVRGGTVLLVPRADPAAGQVPSTPPPATPPAQKTTVVVPSEAFHYDGRKRVFYRVLTGDSLPEVAASFGATVDDVRRWNTLDPAARLVEGMTLQLFVPLAADLSRVVSLDESEVHAVALGSDDFYAYLEAQKGYKRITVAARAGETIEDIGKRYKVSAKTMERVNRRSRSDRLRDGEIVALYVPGAPVTPAAHAAAGVAANDPAPVGPLPNPPVPDLLPLPR